jgi:hypothetical protein
MNDTEKPRQIFRSLKFENRAWEKAEHPRLVSNQIQCSDELIAFEIGFHHGRKRWCLETFAGKNGSKPIKFFSGVVGKTLMGFRNKNNSFFNSVSIRQDLRPLKHIHLIPLLELYH